MTPKPVLFSAGFRRTLVGLKRKRGIVQRADHEFQTNPCGIEAASSGRTPADRPEFQTNPCGIEAEDIIVVEIETNAVSDEPLWD